MSSEFMPLSLDSLAYQSSTAASKASGALTEEELEALGINIVDPDDDMGLEFNDFLQLMVQQLQNQTIDNTTDTSEMLNQLVQMSTVQMLTSLQENLQTLVDASTLNYAASLVGKTVTVGKLDEDGNLQEIVGEVTGTGTYQGTSVIFVNGEMYALNDIMAIGTLPELPDSGDGETDTDGGDGTGTDGGTDSGNEDTSTV